MSCRTLSSDWTDSLDQTSSLKCHLLVAQLTVSGAWNSNFLKVPFSQPSISQWSDLSVTVPSDCSSRLRPLVHYGFFKIYVCLSALPPRKNLVIWAYFLKLSPTSRNCFLYAFSFNMKKPHHTIGCISSLRCAQWKRFIYSGLSGLEDHTVDIWLCATTLLCKVENLPPHWSELIQFLCGKNCW